MSSTRDLIRHSDDAEMRTVVVPEWGVTVRIKSMSAADRAATFQETSENNGAVKLDSFWGRIMTECIIEQDSFDRVFQADDAEWLLSDKSADVISRLSEICMEVSGLSEEAINEAGKDSSGSEGTLSDDSTSDSPAS